jgi:hypothetical protein
MIEFSVTAPTRKRLKYLHKLVESVFGLAKNPDSVELILMYDSDDPETEDYIKLRKEKLPNIVGNCVQITPEMRQQGLNIHDLFFNPAARMARGKYVWGTGNDVEVMTQNWDEILSYEIEEFLSDKPDRLCYTVINHDDLTTPLITGACTFPVFSKEHVDTIGGTMPNEITSWGADQAMFEIYKGLIRNRILNISDRIFVWHHSFHTGRTHREEESKDKSGTEGDSIAYSLSTEVQFITEPQAIQYINKLNNRISTYL